MNKLRGGDRDAFREIVEEHSDMLYRVVFRIVAREDEARDIVQETFIKVWERRSHLRDNSSFVQWITRIAVNRCYDMLRVRKRRRVAGETGWDELWSVEGDEEADKDLTSAEYCMLLEEATSKLSPAQRIVFVLSAIEDRSHDEISGITGMSKDRIKSNLYHARIRVENHLKKRGVI